MSVGPTSRTLDKNNHFVEVRANQFVALSTQARVQADTPPPLTEKLLKQGFNQIVKGKLNDLHPRYTVVYPCDFPGFPRFAIRVGINPDAVDAEGKPAAGYFIIRHIDRANGLSAASSQTAPPPAVAASQVHQAHAGGPPTTASVSPPTSVAFRRGHE